DDHPGRRTVCDAISAAGAQSGEWQGDHASGPAGDLRSTHSREMNAPRSVVVAVAILSGAALAYEILLIRLFAIVDWHHLAFLIIYIALLGYGASGTFIAIVRISRYAEVASLNAMAFAVTSVGSF